MLILHVFRRLGPRPAAYTHTWHLTFLLVSIHEPNDPQFIDTSRAMKPCFFTPQTGRLLCGQAPSLNSGSPPLNRIWLGSWSYLAKRAGGDHAFEAYHISPSHTILPSLQLLMSLPYRGRAERNRGKLASIGVSQILLRNSNLLDARIGLKLAYQ